jgi:hypothetical protein
MRAVVAPQRSPARLGGMDYGSGCIRDFGHPGYLPEWAAGGETGPKRPDSNRSGSKVA